MAAIVCGLQSHLESQLVEPRAFRLRCTKQVPSQPIDFSLKSNFCEPNIKPQNEENNFQDNPNKSISSNSNMGCWSFEALSNVSQITKEQSQKETTYVHPQVKRSSLVLSSKSLELCTENLGNESGTDISENSIEMLSSPNNYGGNLGTGKQRETCQHFAAKKAKTLNFPPPLTTIRGSESLRVRPHRENGRLVIEVTKVPPSPSCFQAQRSHGRLRLCFLTNHTPSFDPEEEDDAKENETLANEVFEEDFESEVGGKIKDSEEDDEEEEGEQECDILQETGEETEEVETGEKDVVVFASGCDESDVFNMEKYERPRRCKQGGEHEHNELLLNWTEPLWVATS